MGLGNLCCICSSSDSVADAAQAASETAPTLRICLAVKIQGNTETRWECQEYQIRFRDTLMWRHAVDHLPDTPLVPDLGSSGQGDEVNNNTEFDMTAAVSDGENTAETECDGEADVRPGDGETLNLKSHWSLSTTHSNSSLETIRASGKSCSRKDASTKTPSPSNSVQTVRHCTKQTDSAKQSQQLLTYNQSQEQSSSDSDAEDIEEEIRRNREDALQRLEGKQDGKPREKHESKIMDRLKWAFGFKSRCGKSQPQFDTPEYQGWAKLSMLIASGLSAEARGLFPPLTEEQEAVLLPVEQKGSSLEVKMKHPGKAAVLCDVKAAMNQIEARKWKDFVVFVRYVDTPQEQREWRTMGEPRVLDWAPSVV
ncbi:hypothetical protein FP744_10004011 [Trichoderma asperellum]